jgi:hypothetical protein
MADGLKELQVIGVYPVEPSRGLFEETVEVQWGPGLSGLELEQARERVREHFAGLYLVEIRVSPPSAEIDWMAITQQIPNAPRSNWQVPYDERCVSQCEGR